MKYARKTFLNEHPAWPDFVCGRHSSGSRSVSFGLIKFQNEEGVTVQEAIWEMAKAGFMPACAFELLFFVAEFRDQLGWNDRIIALGSSNEKYLEYIGSLKPFSLRKFLWESIKGLFSKNPEPEIGHPVISGGDGAALWIMTDYNLKISPDYYFLAVYRSDLE